MYLTEAQRNQLIEMYAAAAADDEKRMWDPGIESIVVRQLKGLATPTLIKEVKSIVPDCLDNLE